MLRISDCVSNRVRLSIPQRAVGVILIAYFGPGEASFVEARLIPERIEHRIETKQRRSERRVRNLATVEENSLQVGVGLGGGPHCLV
jgi:hypothetical protein